MSRRARLLLFLSLAFVACEKEAPPEIPPFLFDPRVAHEPLLEKLKASGGDPSKAIKPQNAFELAKLESGKRYPFVILANGTMVIAPLSVDAPNNFWSHPVLANGGPVRAAGNVRIEKSGDKLTKVTLDQDADGYCPTSDSLKQAIVTLLALKVPSDVVRIEHKPPECWPKPNAPVASASVPVSRVSFGTVMLSVARRFEVIGRATKAKRIELATYQLEELEETFTNELPATAIPPLPPGVTLTPFMESFTKFNIPELRKALLANDPKLIAAAYETMSKTCNGCHQAAKRAYVEVPSVLGESVPRLEPLP